MKIFKSKAFVGVLVVAAFGIVSKNVILPILKLKKGPRDIMEQIGFNLEDIKPKQREVVNPIDLTAIDWPVEFKRDPFLNTILYSNRAKLKKKQEITVDDIIEKRTIEAVKPKPVIMEEEISVDAIMIEAAGRFAVLNGEVVSEGELYKNYTVVKIEPDYVELNGIGGTRKIYY